MGNMGVSIVMGVSEMVGLFQGKYHLEMEWLIWGTPISGNHHMMKTLMEAFMERL